MGLGADGTWCMGRLMQTDLVHGTVDHDGRRDLVAWDLTDGWDGPLA